MEPYCIIDTDFQGSLYKNPPHSALFQLGELHRTVPQSPTTVPAGAHFFGTIYSVLIYLPSSSRQTTSSGCQPLCSNSLRLRSVQHVSLAARIGYPPHNSFRRTFVQHLIAVLDHTIYPRFGCIEICLRSFKGLCFNRNFECKPLGGLLNCSQNHLSISRLLAMFCPGNFTRPGVETW